MKMPSYHIEAETKYSSIGSDNIPALVQIRAWCRPCDKPFSGPMLIGLPYWHIHASPRFKKKDYTVNVKVTGNSFWCYYIMLLISIGFLCSRGLKTVSCESDFHLGHFSLVCGNISLFVSGVMCTSETFCPWRSSHEDALFRCDDFTAPVWATIVPADGLTPNVIGVIGIHKVDYSVRHDSFQFLSSINGFEYVSRPGAPSANMD